MGGLAAALAFSKNDVDVVIVERDPEPPVLASPEDAFDAGHGRGCLNFVTHTSSSRACRPS